MSAQAAVVGALSTCADQTRVFFDILTHDDHNSNYILARCASGSWSTRTVRSGEYAQLAFYDKASYYLTRNGFTGSKRLTERCRQINSLMFDIDCHGDNATAVIPDLTALLYDAFSSGALPEPSLFVYSGRGLHLYYVLDKATPYRVKGGAINERGLKFFRDVEHGLSLRLQRIVSSVSQAEVDTAVYDFTRISRVPGSWNAKANCECTLLSYSTDFYSLATLKSYGDRPAHASTPQPVRRKSHVMKFDRLMTARLRKVEELQAYRRFDCKGSRENMCFVHYNTATQIYGPDEAFRLTCAFNNHFKEPLAASDIAAIKKTVDSVVVQHGRCKGQQGFYPLSARNLSDKLHMSHEEADSVGFFWSTKAEARLAAKNATQDKRKRRNEEIVRLYAKEGLKQAEIVSTLKGTELACCLRTVASVVVKTGAKRAKKISLREATASALRDQNSKGSQDQAREDEKLKLRRDQQKDRNKTKARNGLAQESQSKGEQGKEAHAKICPTSCCVVPLPVSLWSSSSLPLCLAPPGCSLFSYSKLSTVELSSWLGLSFPEDSRALQ